MLFLPNHNWNFEVEVNNHDQFILSAGLEKGVLNI